MKPKERYEKILLTNLQRVDGFLKFAETKNGALLTFASAWSLAIIGILSGAKPLPHDIATALIVALPFVILAGMFAVISFFPRLHLPWFLGGVKAGPHPKNLLYFDDIGSMTVSEFQKLIREKYDPQDVDPKTDQYIKDLTIQIFVNSQITSRKMRLFRLGLLLTAVAAIVVLFPFAQPMVKWLFGL